MSAAPVPTESLVVNFHGIGEPWDGVPADEVAYWCPSGEWPRLADALAEVAARGRVRLAITFDDGNRSDVEAALPALVERDLHATFFVCAGRLGDPHYLDEDDLRGLRDAGMDIGSHGWDHVDLRRLDDARLAQESEGSRVRLVEASVGRVDEFAIPFGSYDRRVLRSLRGYRRVFTSDRGRAPLTGWLTPRESYVRGWGPQVVTRLAEERAALPDRVRRRARVLLKSLR